MTNKVSRRKALRQTPKLILYTLCLAALASCVKISGTISQVVHAPDFLKSQMIANGTAVANGSDQLVVYVHLENADGTPVYNYQPKYDITTGAAVISAGCFSSDANGLSICILKAVTPGVRTMSINNIKQIKLAKQITFTPIPINNNMIQIVSASNQKGSSAHYSIKGSVGNVTSTPRQASQHYVVYGSVQGAIAGQSIQ